VSPRPVSAVSARCTLFLAGAMLASILVLAGPLPRADADGPRAETAALRAPRMLTPANDAHVEAVPYFSWAPVRGAAKYEFQLSADPGFKSIVLGQGRGSFKTMNTFATVDKTLADGDYYWRVRAIDKRDRAGRWAATRTIDKRWTTRPELTAPANGASASYPSNPVVLRWNPVPNAFKYLVFVATDPALAHSALDDKSLGVETSATSFSLRTALAPGRYYWAVTPVDADKHSGTRSAVSAFDWTWPTHTTARVTDLNADARVFDPQFSWDQVPGAAEYQVEVNPSEDFAIGSKVCCDEPAYGTSLSPLRLLPNNRYYWRVRALDIDGNAGSWNAGPSFRKTFDDVVPTIPRLRVRDNLGDAPPPAGSSGLPTTPSPVIAWDPVPGASSYEIILAPWECFCNWTATTSGKPTARTSLTATTAWTPLSPTTTRHVGNAFTAVNKDNWKLANDTSYCVRVRARSDRDAKSKEIVSDWTQIGGLGKPAFTYHEVTRPPCTPVAAPASAYREPAQGRVSTRMPLFTWNWVSGACGYFVVIARDAEFTKIVDVAYTNYPADAPRSASMPITYADETTSYYWAVMPTVYANGDGLSTQPQENHPQAFEKRSLPPQLVSPAQGSDVTSQPAFRWTAAEGARQYRIQVAADPTFGDPIADVLTNSTAYTSTSALPADTALYWRVRANDEGKIGLTWSETRAFRRRLPVPRPTSDNLLSGETIPTLSWSPVDGAVSYDMHVEQADGTKRDFNLRSTLFTPVIFYGTGVWHWQIRANFKAGFRVVSGGYSSDQPFGRRIATPTGIQTRRPGNRALLSWNPATQAAHYKVQISTSDSFSTLVEQVTTSNTSFAPKMTASAYRSGKPLWWRVATVDEGNNIGGYAVTPLRSARPMRVRVRGKLRRARRSLIRLTVTTSGRRRVAKAHVRVTGRGLGIRPRTTGRRGTVTFRLRPMARGKVRFRVEKRGYATVEVVRRVR
jgi:hypothetical protein